MWRLVAVVAAARRLVGLAEADQVRRHRAEPGVGEDGDHPAVEVAPRRLAVEHQHRIGVRRPLVDVVHPEPARQVGPVRVERVVGKVPETLVRGAQHSHPLTVSGRHHLRCPTPHPASPARRPRRAAARAGCWPDGGYAGSPLASREAAWSATNRRRPAQVVEDHLLGVVAARTGLRRGSGGSGAPARGGRRRTARPPSPARPGRCAGSPAGWPGPGGRPRQPAALGRRRLEEPPTTDATAASAAMSSTSSQKRPHHDPQLGRRERPRQQRGAHHEPVAAHHELVVGRAQVEPRGLDDRPVAVAHVDHDVGEDLHRRLVAEHPHERPPTPRSLIGRSPSSSCWAGLSNITSSAASTSDCRWSWSSG